jgi:erythromycin esterase
MMKLKGLAVAIVLFGSLAGLAFDAGGEPDGWRNTLDFDFEYPALHGWFVGGEFNISLDSSECSNGGQSLCFRSIGGAEPVLPGFAAARLPVHPFRGKRIRFSGALKTTNTTVPFSLWLRADAGDDPAAFSQLSRRGPKGATGWKRYSVELDVPMVTTTLYMGAVFQGEGSAWLDDLAIDVLPARGTNPITVGGRVLDNDKKPVPNALVAAKLLFHETARACTASDKDGKFLFHLPVGLYMLTTTAPGQTAGVLPYREYNENTGDLVLKVGEHDGFTIKGKVNVPKGETAAGSFVVANRLESVNSTIFYVPLGSDGRFQVTAPIGEAYRVDLDSPRLKAVPAMVDKVSAAGETRGCVLEAAAPHPAPDEVVSWMKREAVSIRTPEAGSGFSDLLPLKAAIGDARVVAMGETTHGTREMFQLKRRFLEFLVEEMEFTVFVMEGVEVQGSPLNDYVLHGNGDPVKALSRYPVWCTEEVIGMIRWMREYNADPAHTKKVKFHGMETCGEKDAAEHVKKFLEKVDPAAAREFETIFSLFGKDDIYELLLKYSGKEYRVLEKNLKELLSRLDRRKAAYTSGSSPQEWRRARHYARCLQQSAESTYLPGVNDYHYLDFRARFMAENVEWILAGEPPGTRAMLWAHNFHISLSPYPGYPFVFMGMHLRRTLGDDYLPVGFVFNRGSFQGLNFTSADREQSSLLQSFSVGPYPGSFGSAMSRTGVPYFFLDLRRAPDSGPVHDWFSVPHVCKWVNYIYNCEKDIKYLFQLPLLYDAVIFIDKTTRAHPLPAGRQPDFPY